MTAEPQNHLDTSRELLCVRELSLEYLRRDPFASARTETVALENASFDLREGETLALVGPSGSGKSSLARCLVLLERPSAGRILYKGQDILTLPPDALKAVRKEIHLVFQDSASALNPRRTVEELVAEPLVIHECGSGVQAIKERIAEVLDQVELGSSWRGHRPRELSGGQRQRVAIARALVFRPRLLILDEALSSLDLSAQAQIANLLLDLQERHSLAYLYVTHDLRMAGALAHQVALLEAGRIVHCGLPAEVLTPNLQPVS
ncbi:MAG: dipeptide/oligopeptide/nickel ABC transporter ATP-binding protein [Candidatus Acidiferrum sp.]|jgi:ABC-type glutathione transport system ATPase component